MQVRLSKSFCNTCIQQCEPINPYFRVRAAFFDHTVRGALSPPHTSRRWDRQLRDMPETEI